MLHLPRPPGAPEVPGSPPPAFFVTARLPVCRLPTPAHFPGREAAEGREFLEDYPARSAPPPAPQNPALGLGARPGCSEGIRAVHQRALRGRPGCTPMGPRATPDSGVSSSPSCGPWDQPGSGSQMRIHFSCLSRRVSSRPRVPKLSKLEGSVRRFPLNIPQGDQEARPDPVL